MLKNVYFFGFISLNFFCSTKVLAQTINDTIKDLEKVILKPFQRSIPYLESTTSAYRISEGKLKLNHPERLLESINLIPGAKLEERSPGSYRLSLRGSTIRSPFGVRNVKIYLDDFVLSDVTGNAYLNLIEPSFVQSISIMKGPQGGEFGSETGGVMLLNTVKNDILSFEATAGSFGLLSEKIKFGKKIGRHHLQLGQSYYQSKSYREQSAIKKTSFFVKNDWSYNDDNSLKLMLLYTDLHYEMPGGLTKQQMEANPRQARLATNTLGGSVDQNAGIYNKTILAGISHLWQLNKKWSQFTSLQSSFTDFENPFITNYEFRKEDNLQGRFYLNFKNELSNIKLNSRIGFEGGINSSQIENFDNIKGAKGEKQKLDNIKTNGAFYYITQFVQIKEKWFLDASLSLNTMQYHWESRFPKSEFGKKKFNHQWLPNIAITYKINPTLSVRAKVAKGSSSPTTEEVRSSNQVIQEQLLTEYGWNKELGIRKRIGSVFIELTAFDFNLKDAIVKRQDENGNDNFINAGGTSQSGLELTIESKKYRFIDSYFDSFNFLITGNIYDFKYRDYLIDNNNYSGNRLPGISDFSTQILLNVGFLKRFNISYTNYFNSKIYLNDANTFEESAKIIGNILLDSEFKIKDSLIKPYLGISNIYNTKYSLGYDINAFGNRFYNPVATINFYLGVKFNY